MFFKPYPYKFWLKIFKNIINNLEKKIKKYQSEMEIFYFLYLCILKQLHKYKISTKILQQKYISLIFKYFSSFNSKHFKDLNKTTQKLQVYIKSLLIFHLSVKNLSISLVNKVHIKLLKFIYVCSKRNFYLLFSLFFIKCLLKKFCKN